MLLQITSDSRLLISLVGGSLSACSFLLDFDELQSETSSLSVEDDAGVDDDDSTDDDSDDDVDDNSADDSDDADDDSEPTDASTEDCEESCDDGDPCTTDACVDGECVSSERVCPTTSECTEASCVDGECVEEPVVGIIADGLEFALEADAIHRNTLVGSGDRFYTATYGVFNGESDLQLRAFDTDSDDPIAEFSPSLAGATMASPASLVADTRLGLELNVYGAVRLDEGELGEVFRLPVDRNLQPLTDGAELVALSNYRPIADTWGPSAAQTPNGDPFVTWVGFNGTSSGVYFHEANTAPPNNATFITVDDVTGIKAITAGSQPAVVWMVNRPNGVALRAGVVDGPILGANLVQCDQREGFVGHRLDVDESIPNVWSVAWTKRNGDEFISEITSIACTSDGCADNTPTGAGGSCTLNQIEGRVFPDARSLSTRTLRRQGDPDNVLYQMILLGAQDDGQGLLLGLLNRLEFDLISGTSSKPVSVEKDAIFDLTSAAQTPRFPEITMLPPDRLALSWIRPLADGSADELIVERHRICYPD